MSLQKYQALVKTAEYGSFTRAAEALNYTQSGVSRMIADLEKEWEVSLLERRHGGVHLTAEGELLLPQIRRICEEQEKLQMQIDDLHGLDSGHIRIGTFASVSAHLLPYMLKVFREDYPNIDFDLVTGDYTEIENWIRDGTVDCGFLVEPVPGDLETIFLQRNNIVVMLPPDHPLASCEKFPVKALEKDPFILMEQGFRAEIPEFLARHNIHPDVQFRAWDDYAVMCMVENGLGISLTNQLIIKRTNYDIVFKELDVPAYRDIVFALRSKKTASLAVKRFLDYLDVR
ncbi:MAG: LysR family transcriptional regulator [Butyricicoccus sp.]|nr:LysR family transcriptional regulator [Butyricicoccus sp.]MBQ8585518.1 LysR family transcriptional regulator [Butyricicoccus sp.]